MHLLDQIFKPQQHSQPKMKQQGRCTSAAFLVHLMLPFLIPGNAIAHTVYFYISNKCPFPIWPATAPNTGQPVIADGGFYLPAGQTRRIQAPWMWSGRLWARTGCNFPAAAASAANSTSSSSSWRPACDTGDCDGRPACGSLVGTPPATLVQVSLQGGTGKPHYYDVSLVDGYNLPVSIYAIKSRSCTIGGCRKDVNEVCPEELRVRNRNGDVVACKSACLAFNVDSFCCRNRYGTPDKCKPNTYSRIFKDACPSYYSYAFDSPPPLVTCGAEEYVISFCPSKWGGESLSQM